LRGISHITRGGTRNFLEDQEPDSSPVRTAIRDTHRLTVRAVAGVRRRGYRTFTATRAPFGTVACICVCRLLNRRIRMAWVGVEVRLQADGT